MTNARRVGRLARRGRKVDFIIRKTDEYSLVAFERRRRLKADGFMIWAISKEDLILAKLLWFKASESPQQRRDVQHLVNLPYDEIYVQFWAEKLGVDALLQRCETMMNTTPAMQKLYRDKLMECSNEERFMMGLRSFNVARAMALASFPPDLDETEQRVALFLRFYGNDFTPEKRAATVASLRSIKRAPIKTENK